MVIDWGWGEYQMIYVDNDALDFLSDGDEIHVIDQNGIITVLQKESPTQSLWILTFHQQMRPLPALR